MAWSTEKFKLGENEEEENNDEDDCDDEEQEGAGGGAPTGAGSRTYVLAVCLADGDVVLLRSFDDVSPVTIHSGLKPPLHAEWSNSRKLLAIAGIKDTEQQQSEYTNLLKFYSNTGTIVYTIVVPFTQVSSAQALSSRLLFS